MENILKFEKEVVQILNPEFPIKTHIIDSNEGILPAPTHWHDEIEIIYMIKVEMAFWIGGQKIDVNEGRIILINSMVVHSSELTESLYAKFLLLQFNTDLLYSNISSSELRYLTPFMNSGLLDYQLIDNQLKEDYVLLTALLNEILNEFYQKKSHMSFP